MNRTSLSVLLLFIFSLPAFSQSKMMMTPMGAVVDAGRISEDWNAELEERDETGDEFSRNDTLNKLKQRLLQRLNPSGKKYSSVRDEIDTPYVWFGLQGENQGNSVPNDNDIAVSNSGYLISVMNT